MLPIGNGSDAGRIGPERTGRNQLRADHDRGRADHG